MNTTLLKSVMVQNHETQTELANAMGMVQSAINARINGKIEFRQNEIQFIRNRYHLTSEMTDLIFFNEEVS